MKPQHQGRLLLHPLFILSIAILFLNDVHFKYEYHNWLTGKLSDFAGLFAFPIFFVAFFPSYKKYIFMGCALFFIWWKSALSQSLIDYASNFFSINRTVDYSDLMALIILPLAYQLKYTPHVLYSRATVSMIAVVSLFSFCNTSMGYRELYYPYRDQYEVRDERTFKTKGKEVFFDKLKKMGIEYRKDSIRYYPAIKYDFYRRVQSGDSAVTWMPVTNNNDTAMYLMRKRPFYIIPEYIINGDTFRNIEFHFNDIGPYDAKLKTKTVWLESFRMSDPGKYWNRKKKYKKTLKALFKD